MRRVIFALAGLGLLIAAVWAGQTWLDRSTEEMDRILQRAESAFSEEQGETGAAALEEFSAQMEKNRLILSLFCHDTQLRELDRGLMRANRLAKEKEYSLAAEETADLRQSLRDLSDLFRPTAVNLL